MDYRNELAKNISDLLNYPFDKVVKLVKIANKNIDADYAINCFGFKPIFKKNGKEIAQDLYDKYSDKFQNIDYISEIKIAGPYLNFKINKNHQKKILFSEIDNSLENYALSKIISEGLKSERVVVEYPSPNTNKPLHLGHIRNMLLGQTLSTLNKFIKNYVFQTNLLNDRGVHICKSMWAYQKFGNNKTPKTENRKPDHFVGDYYVKYSKYESELKKKIKNLISELEKEKLKPNNEKDPITIKNLEEKINNSEYGKLQNEIKQMLQDWENKDKKVLSLWRKMNSWAEQGIRETLELYEIHHDKWYYESEIYDKGKEIVLEGLKKGIFERLDDGAIICRFNKKGLPKQKVLLRKDGTTLYITQDLYLAQKKMDDYDYDLSLYVIGNEQDMQLRTVFDVLKKLGMKGRNIHYSYGMINLTTGKMKSREGIVVDADDLFIDLKNMSLDEVMKRYKEISQEEMEHRANIIAMAAIRFFILKYEFTKDFLFDPQQSISFEGETGPYILYAYARICSIFKKGIEDNVSIPYNPNTDSKGDLTFDDIDISLLNDENEINLVDHIYNYPEIIYDSAINLKPHLLARYILEMAQLFNTFYHSCQILKEEESVRNSRLYLCEIVRKVLKQGLNLLKINVLNEM